MNKPITLCDRCDICMSCLLDYDGIPCRKNRTVNPTNADRIRAMTDEELARWAWAVQSGIFCADIYTTDEWLDWMKQEADNE